MNTPAFPSPNEVLERDRAEAFQLLAQIVQENHEAGRRSYGASLKPELRRRTFNGFDEARLRYDTFRQFLVAAADTGVVVLQRASRGPDVMLAPPGQAPIDASRDTLGDDRRIRRDLWDCFVDWDDRYRRAYDVEDDLAVLFPANSAPLEPPDKAEFRRRATEDPSRFRPIEPVSFTTQLDWMRAFAEAVEDPLARVALTTAFVSSRPARAFTQALIAHPKLRGQWRRHLQMLVEKEIRRWADEQELQQLEIHESEQAPPTKAHADVSGDQWSNGEAPPAGEDERLRRMREQLKRIIDRMPAAELERLTPPFGYTFDS